MDLVVRMSESKCAERKRRELLWGSRAEWHETREREHERRLVLDAYCRHASSVEGVGLWLWSL